MFKSNFISYLNQANYNDIEFYDTKETKIYALFAENVEISKFLKTKKYTV